MPGMGARRRRGVSVLLCCQCAAGFLGTRPAAPPRARRTSEVSKRRRQQRGVTLRAEANDDGDDDAGDDAVIGLDSLPDEIRG